MENTIKNSDKRGVRKPVALLIMGDESAIIHPMFLHINKAGYMRGLAIDPNFNAKTFVLSKRDFQKTTIHMVKVHS